jgi:hypothetical protein
LNLREKKSGEPKSGGVPMAAAPLRKRLKM